MANGVKAFIEENLTVKQKREFLQYDIDGFKDVQKGYKKGGIAFNLFQKRIQEKQKELDELE
ncbi:hypothetical protein WAF17_02610 [Bernardetia sp. ABR2-2B]|uniref:hypothetical protein n=1 Tax=Bernardetia sp. ABR2-2B TaxID=3127472 RepID=UPI0030CC9A90